MSSQEDDRLDSSLKTIAKSSIFVFIFIFLARIVFYFYRVIIARNFGPEIYGSFSLVIAIFSFLTTFSLLGFSEGILRFVPLYRGTGEIKKIRYLLRWSIGLLTSSSIILGIILFFSSGFVSSSIFHDPNLAIFLKILSFAIPFYIIGSVFLCFLRGFEKIKEQVFISEFLQNLSKLIFLFVFIALGTNLNSIVFSHFAGIVIVFIVAYLYSRYKLPEIFKRTIFSREDKKNIQKSFFNYSVPLIFSGILYVLFGYADSVILGIFKTSSDVGFYNAALPLATFLIFLPILFLQIFLPMITREFSEKRFNLVNELTKQVQKWIFIINLPIFLLMFLFSGALINLIFGAEYLVAEQALRILSVGLFVYSMTQTSENLILAIGKSKITLLNIFLSLILNVILNVILVPKYGINGAAIAVTSSYIFSYFLLFFQVRYYTGVIPLRRKMLLVFISVIIPALILFYLRTIIEINTISMILLCSLFFLLYAILIFVTKSFDENDLMILKSIKKRFF